MKNLSYKGFLTFLDQSPKVESLLEVSFSVLLSFIPFLFGSLFAQSDQETFSIQQYKDVLVSYFNGGELTLLILAVCGSIMWITAIRQRAFNFLGRFASSVFIFLVSVLFVGGIIGSNPGFSEKSPNWILWMTLLLYFGALIFWYFALLNQKEEKVPRTNSDKRAKDIREEAYLEN